MQFPRWAEVLADSSLGPKEREGFKITIRWYLSWCARNSVGCSVGSARDFIEWAEEEKQPTAWMLKQWNASILKVMRCGKGGKDRVAPLSEKLVADIETHLVKVRALFEEDLHTCHAKTGHWGAPSVR